MESPFDLPGSEPSSLPRRKRELRGPAPNPLKVVEEGKVSRRMIKRSPTVIHSTSPENFRDLVQQLTGFSGPRHRVPELLVQHFGTGDIHGREDDITRVIELLLSADRRRYGVSVVQIVGAAGVGKTAVAQIIFNNLRACKVFDTSAWVSANGKFDVKWLTSAVVESLSGVSCGLTSLTELQEAVREELTGRRFLIVLDNIPHVDPALWFSFLVSLTQGAKGSAVVVTSRDEMVASSVGGMYSYKLNQLPKDDSWLVFQKVAFDARDSSAYPGLMEIGNRIVRKCRGNPLAVRAIGGLLQSTTDEQLWNDVLRSDLWDAVEPLPALRLSYEHLPPHLKQCFRYCSLFPKGYVFVKDHLVRLWMAEGFINSEEGRQVEEDIGTEYFDDLLRRSFFMHISIHNHEETKYVMHDLVHDLAESVSQSECFRAEDCKLLSSTTEGVCHTSLVSGEVGTVLQFEPLKETRDLRTFLLVNSVALKWNESLFHIENLGVLNDLFLSFRWLRTLDLSYSSIKMLPDSVANLRTLRYLALSNTRIKRLPEAICDLYNLQTLELRGCAYLHELPKNMKRLANLRHLDVQQESGFVLMPRGIRELKDLRTLSVFCVGREEWHCGIGEVRDLVNIRGSLCIGGLENVVKSDVVREANLKMEYLQVLTLKWSNDWEESEPDETAEIACKVLQNLQPHTNLKELVIQNYIGGQFPGWMGDPSFSKLVSVTLDNCCECNVLPPLGQLPSLRYLSIRKMDGIQSIHMTGFPLLESLKLWDMPELEEWCGVEDGDFPCLRSLSISRCAKLRKLPCLTFLVELSVHFCIQLPEFSGLPRLRLLKIEGFYKLMSLPLQFGLPSLKILEISHCSQLSLLEGLSYLVSLETLRLFKCPMLNFSASEKLPPMLQVVDIQRGCPLLCRWLPYGFEEIASANLESWRLIRQELLSGDMHEVLDMPEIHSSNDNAVGLLRILGQVDEKSLQETLDFPTT